MLPARGPTAACVHEEPKKAGGGLLSLFKKAAETMQEEEAAPVRPAPGPGIAPLPPGRDPVPATRSEVGLQPGLR